MPWNQNDYPSSMKNLPDATRNKAIQIANVLLKSGKDDSEAIRIGIAQAKKWSADHEKVASFGEAMAMLKTAEFREDHWQPKKKTNKKEIAEDVMLGGLGVKGGSVVGAGLGLAKAKQTPLANPVGLNEVKTRQARKLVNGALHNHQAKWSGIKGGLAGAGVGLGLAGAGMAYNHFHNKEQEKTASANLLHDIFNSMFQENFKIASENERIPEETKSHNVVNGNLKPHKHPWQVPTINLNSPDDIVSGHTTIHADKPSLLNRAYSDITHKPINYGINRSSDYVQTPDIKGALEFVERTANPATRREAVSEIFSNNQAQRYENITPRPLLFGKKKWEHEILQPKKSVVLDVADKGGNYHPLMQVQSKHWAETGRGMHTKKS